MDGADSEYGSTKGIGCGRGAAVSTPVKQYLSVKHSLGDAPGWMIECQWRVDLDPGVPWSPGTFECHYDVYCLKQVMPHYEALRAADQHYALTLSDLHGWEVWPKEDSVISYCWEQSENRKYIMTHGSAINSAFLRGAIKLSTNSFDRNPRKASG